MKGPSSFLTEVAKGYDARVSAVCFSSLPGNMRGGVWAHKDDNFWRIDIDDANLICPFQNLYVFYHELGHIVLGHCDSPNKDEEFREREATRWALLRMSTIDINGQINPGLDGCFRCMTEFLDSCLKEAL